MKDACHCARGCCLATGGKSSHCNSASHLSIDGTIPAISIPWTDVPPRGPRGRVGSLGNTNWCHGGYVSRGSLLETPGENSPNPSSRSLLTLSSHSFLALSTAGNMACRLCTKASDGYCSSSVHAAVVVASSSISLNFSSKSSLGVKNQSWDTLLSFLHRLRHHCRGPCHRFQRFPPARFHTSVGMPATPVGSPAKAFC